MSLAVVASRTVVGWDAPEVRVEVHLANGLPSFTLVGLADTEVKEARERVRAALAHSGLPFPHNKRITVNLAPADLPKESGRFDLPIALGILAAAGAIPAERLQGYEFAGELSLAGAIRPVRGAIALALAARRSTPAPILVLPAASAALAAQVEGIDVRSATHLLEVVQVEPLARALPAPALVPAASPPPDLADVRGQAEGRRAVEVAAAGGHSLLLVGPPGVGKSMLAERLLPLLPPLSNEEWLTSAALADLARHGNASYPIAKLGRQRPFRTPHHTTSAAALVGGGSPPRPGEVSLAHGGVLFLDELPEFPRASLEALREPLEAGRVTISRAARQAVFPARFQLVAAMNPCPCGWLGATWGSHTGGRHCRCTPDAVARYQGRLSGPLLDRIDLIVEIGALRPEQILGAPEGEPSSVVAARVACAVARRAARHDPGPGPVDDSALRLLQQAAARLQWSARVVRRVLAVAQTLADLAGAGRIGTAQVAEAVQLRRGIGLLQGAPG
jgi:magnesium chelatase family protein